MAQPKSLKQLRKKIDHLDQSLLNLLSDRGRLVELVAEIKNRHGASIFAPARERDLLRRLKEINPGPLPAEAIDNVFREIVHACRSLEKQLRVAFFGPEATFTHQAALRAFGRQAKLLACRTIADVFSEVDKERADYGVVPIENSTEGVVNHTLDMFVDSELSICAEIELPISHYLLGRSKANHMGKGIKVLYSFPQALAQCRGWIEGHMPEARVIEASSTAEAARLAVSRAGSAAIASKLAADLYKLQILAPRIEDVSHNFTRFLVIGTAEPASTGRDKTSIMFSIKDRVGALYDMLIPFKAERLNLTKIESRPTRKRAWEYIFFVDFLGHRSEARVQKALERLEKSCVFLKVLGSYPRTE